MRSFPKGWMYCQLLPGFLDLAMCKVTEEQLKDLLGQAGEAGTNRHVWLGEGKQDIASGPAPEQLRPDPLVAVLAEVLSASIIRTPHSICSGRVVMVSCLMGCFGMFWQSGTV